jgi:hypothetical protein
VPDFKLKMAILIMVLDGWFWQPRRRGKLADIVLLSRHHCDTGHWIRKLKFNCVPPNLAVFVGVFPTEKRVA